MQQLHLVGFTADNRGLIFSARKGAKSGGFVVTLDDKLLARVDEMVARRDEEQDSRASNRPKSSLSPREIQARLRAGRTIAQVAREAGVEEEWVARWAAPIAAEQAQVVERAQELTMEKNRVGPSAVALGEAVRWNMADKGIVFTDAGWTGSWDAFHLRANSWMVRFTYVYRRATHQAEWEVDTREAVVSSRNRQATDLGYVAPGSRRPKMPRSMLAAVDLPSVAPALPAASSGTTGSSPAASPPKAPAPRSAPARKKASGSKDVAARTAAAKKKWAAIKKAADRKAAADRIASKKAAAKKAAAAKKEAAQKAAAREAAAKKAAAKKAAAKKAAAKKTAAKKTAAKKTAAKKTAAKKSTPRKVSTKKSTPRKASTKSTPRKSTPRKAPAKNATTRSARAPGAKKAARRASPAKRRPPAVAPPARVAQPATEPARVSPRAASSPPRATNRPRTRPAQAAPARPARRTNDSSAGPERRFAAHESEREVADRQNDSTPAPETGAAPASPARTPIRIDSGVPRRDTGGSPIIRADRADQSREEPAGVGARSAENGSPRQGRFRFRRSRNRN